MAGIRFATFISLMAKKLKPIPAMIRLPTADISRIMSGVRWSLIACDARTMEPWYTNTDRAEKAVPIPKEAPKMSDIQPSRIDFANNIW